MTQVRVILRPWRVTPGPAPPPPLNPWLLLSAARRLTAAQRADVKVLLAAHPALATGYRLKERFLALVAQRDAAALAVWLHDAAACGLAVFRRVARSMRRDPDAVRAALTTPWSTGQVEGQITRLKLIKRMGYGRAKPDLLRRRVLHRLPA